MLQGDDKLEPLVNRFILMSIYDTKRHKSFNIHFHWIGAVEQVMSALEKFHLVLYIVTSIPSCIRTFTLHRRSQIYRQMKSAAVLLYAISWQKHVNFSGELDLALHILAGRVKKVGYIV